MNNVNYFSDIFESIPVYKSIVLILFVMKNDVNFFYQCGFLNSGLNFLYTEYKHILLEVMKII